jgi:hypothetical protein
MELSSEMFKLIGIVGGGLVIGIVGQVVILKKKKKKAQESEEMYDSYGKGSDESKSVEGGDVVYSNLAIKDYILQYKGQYGRESIKTALINAGNDAGEVERYLVKFFDSGE